ncbi:MAG: ABC transporter permease [Corallococcus sp.]|nr:ABC transporter permease [Bacillota bacterium]MCM1533377.1 ABC transporter permease [Corallococcus sp.]
MKKTNENLENNEINAALSEQTEQIAEKVSLADNVRVISPWRMVMRRFFRSRLSIVGLAMLIVLLLFVFIGPLFAVWGEAEIDYSQIVTHDYKVIKVKDASGEEYTVYEITTFTSDVNKLAAPLTYSDEAHGSRLHVLGTDKNGRDIFTRLMYGGQKSITLSFFTVLLYVALGIILGAIAGYVGKWADQIIMRIVDVINCIPSLPIMLILSAILESLAIPQASRIYYLMGILTLLNWTGIARLVRGQILFLREQEYMVAADALGLSAPRKIFKHLIPNVIPQLIVVMTLGLGSMILYEATLGYLGLGFPLEVASWGLMVNGATDPNVLKYYSYVWVPSGICIILAVLAFNFIGDGLRDALDPKMKR